MTANLTFGRAARFALLALGAAIMLFPYLWMIATALKPASEVFSSGLSLLPSKWSAVENFSKAMTRIPMARILMNGVIVCAGIVVFQVLFAFPAAYALAKLRFRGREFLFGVVMLGLLVPIHAISIPL
ncbi:MAG: carbohydrate ABC transporter permease, partial [Elsteraceae bacterium]